MLKWQQRLDEAAIEARGAERVAAQLILKLGGALKFHEEDQWYSDAAMLPNDDAADEDEDERELTVEAVDMRGANLVYEAFDTLEQLSALRYLDLSGCRFVNDWCLYRLYAFRDTLWYLDVSNCPQVRERKKSSTK